MGIPVLIFPVSGKGWCRTKACQLLLSLEENLDPGALAQVKAHLAQQGHLVGERGNGTPAAGSKAVRNSMGESVRDVGETVACVGESISSRLQLGSIKL